MAGLCCKYRWRRAHYGPAFRTRIGKYVFNHAFLIPGVIAITLCVILGFIFGGIML
ncbi:TPA: hypothetical protein MAR54_004049 [Klebsiella pneumoniae]|nr:hypothetical protein [Klebsiella pneumoniae]